MTEKRKAVSAQLNKINQITYQSTAQVCGPEIGNATQPSQTSAKQQNVNYAAQMPSLSGYIPMPPPFINPAAIAWNLAPYYQVYTSTIGDVPAAEIQRKKRKVRSDKGKRRPIYKARECKTCLRNSGSKAHMCKGWNTYEKCE